MLVIVTEIYVIYVCWREGLQSRINLSQSVWLTKQKFITWIQHEIVDTSQIQYIKIVDLILQMPSIIILIS